VEPTKDQLICGRTGVVITKKQLEELQESGFSQKEMNRVIKVE